MQGMWNYEKNQLLPKKCILHDYDPNRSPKPNTFSLNMVGRQDMKLDTGNSVHNFF